MWCPNVWCRGAKYVVPWCQICSAVVTKMWCQLVPLVQKFPSNLARFRGFPEMLTTSYNLRSPLVTKTPQNSPKTPLFDQKWPQRANRKSPAQTGSAKYHAHHTLHYSQNKSFFQKRTTTTFLFPKHRTKAPTP